MTFSSLSSLACCSLLIQQSIIMLISCHILLQRTTSAAKCQWLDSVRCPKSENRLQQTFNKALMTSKAAPAQHLLFCMNNAESLSRSCFYKQCTLLFPLACTVYMSGELTVTDARWRIYRMLMAEDLNNQVMVFFSPVNAVKVFAATNLHCTASPGI